MRAALMPESGSVDRVPTVAPLLPAPSSGSRSRVRRALPYLVGAGMFAVAVWVLHSTLRRYDLADLHAELAEISTYHVGLAVLFTIASFMALVGYEPPRSEALKVVASME